MLKKVVALILVLALLAPAAAMAVTYYRVNTTWLKAHETPPV